MEKTYIFQNVNIDSMNFTNNRNDIMFEFLDSLAGSGQPCGTLLCSDVISLTMTTNLDDDPFFPQFICDISIENAPDNYGGHLITFEGGSYYISIICKTVLY